MPTPSFPGYPIPQDRYDEMCAADGQPRLHWRPLLQALATSTPAQWRQRGEAARQHIRENGMTYNVYADAEGADRPWELDVLPLLLPADEWAGIAAAIAQRATLLNQVLADLYGPQDLLEKRMIPPALVYGHNGYLWACRGIRPPGGRHLHVYAADLARSPDGQWWVIADRTQAPSGAGYALENRQIIARLYPALYRELRVRHMDNPFRVLLQTLVADAPVDPGETPLLVLLTPGPHNETYFEHVYLARQLGLPLVEGTDLTVRGDSLYLKTVGGLQRVHVLLRRLDDDYCDPLDLRTDSTLGVPGLVDIARLGRVLVANALGSGVMESAGIAGFLPRLCEHLLGESLLMPSVATWWCGEAGARAFVEANLERLVLKPAYPSQRMEPVFGDRLTAAERDGWIARIRARPNAYVAQELVRLSQAPAVAGSPAPTAVLQPCSIGLRVYAVAGAGGYQVLPGGLARASADGGSDVLSMQRGGSSKDIWVLPGADKPGGRGSSGGPVAGGGITARGLVRQSANLPSRSAENLFWLGRYAERVDCHARLLRVALLHRLEDSGEAAAEARLFDWCAACGLLPLAAPPSEGLLPGPDDREPAQQPDARLLAAIFDTGWPGSLGNNVQRAARAALQVRERLSVDHWQAVERLHEGVRRRPESTRPDLALPIIDRTLLAGTTLSGYGMDDMVQDAGWRFLMAGRHIERIQVLAFLTRNLLLSPDPTGGIESLLKIAGSADVWRRRYLRAPELLPALDILVFDADNPHGLLFQAARLRDQVDRLTATGERLDPGLDAAIERLSAFDLGGLEPGLPGGGEAQLALASLISALADATAGISEQLGNRFFTHVAEATSTSLAV